MHVHYRCPDSHRKEGSFNFQNFLITEWKILHFFLWWRIWNHFRIAVRKMNNARNSSFECCVCLVRWGWMFLWAPCFFAEETVNGNNRRILRVWLEFAYSTKRTYMHIKFYYSKKHRPPRSSLKQKCEFREHHFVLVCYFIQSFEKCNSVPAPNGFLLFLFCFLAGEEWRA